jgi:5-deoxy-5-amino-3-dehydroquinate synthase
VRISRDHVVVAGSVRGQSSSVARLVAGRLGRRLVEAETATAGLGRALAAHDPTVVALTLPADLDPGQLATLGRGATLVWLREESVPTGAASLTQSARFVLDVGGLEEPQLAARVLAALLRRVTVEVPDRPYDVVVGPGARGVLADALPRRARRAVVVTQAGIGVEVETGIDTLHLTIPDGESAKSLTTVERLCRELARSGVTRHDVVVAVGGGVVTDTAGFAASCYHRGIDLVSVSTTLLGQLDAAIGGKTGVNLPEGKNLVGSFWQPVAVLCDTDTLTTLPDAEWRSGLGEMAKYAFLGLDELDELPLSEQVARCAALKAAIVAEDEREGGRRMLLNYGHTLAHALEAAGFAADSGEAGSEAAAARPMRHGEAVGIGLVFAARLARRLGRIDDARVERHVDVVDGYGLETAVPEGADHALLVRLMGRDKKATDGLTFVLDGPRGVEAVGGVDPAEVVAALGDCSQAAAAQARRTQAPVGEPR